MQLSQDSVGHIFELLKGAQSQNPQIQQSSEASLKKVETVSGYASCLAQVIAAKEADHTARWMAAIQLKNVITKQWRTRPGSGGISDEEKTHLRQVMPQLIPQDNQQLAVPIAIAFAKIARADYPKVWPDMLEKILGLMQGGSVLLVRRCFLVLHHIIKELASMRLPADKRNFEEVTKLLFGMYVDQWYKDTHALAEGLPQALQTPQQPSPLMLVFERWFLELKGLGKMLLFGIKSDSATLQPSAEVAKMAQGALQALQKFHAERPRNLTMRAQVHAMLDRALHKLSKFLHDIQEVHPWTVYNCGCLKASTEFFCGVLTQEPQNGPAYEGFLMRAMIFLNDTQLSKAYREQDANALWRSGAPSDDPDQKSQQIVEMGKKVTEEMRQFWLAGSARALCQSLVHYHLPLTVKELQEWAYSPEEFHHQLGQGAWQDSIRNCAETLFTTLLQDYKDELAPVVLDILRATSAGEASTSGRPDQAGREGYPFTVLAREAAYNAAALGVWSLMDSLDFPTWLHSSLLQEIRDTSPQTKPLRRRAALVVSAWFCKIRAQDRPPVYAAMLELMGDDDLAISLTGFKAMRDLIEDWEFAEDQFYGCVEPCFRIAGMQMQSADDLESQIQIFNLLNSILDRLEVSVKPFMGTLIQMLPEVWTESKDQSLLRIQILLALQRTVKVLELDSPMVYPIVFPVLQECLDPQQGDSLNLLEDSLHLWLITLRNAPQVDHQLFAPFGLLESIMKNSTEHLEVASAIMLSAAVLGRTEDQLRMYGGHVAAILETLIGHLGERGMRVLLPVMDALLQVFPQLAPSLLWNALKALLADLFSGREDSIVTAAILGIFARLVIVHQEAFLMLITDCRDQNGRVGLDALLELWVDRFDSLPNTYARKLSAMALCSIIQLPLSCIPKHFTSIVAHLTAVWCETEGEDAADYTELRMQLYPHSGTHFPESATVESEEAEGEYQRLQALHSHDPVQNLQLSAIAKQAVNLMANVHAAQGIAENAIQALPPELLSQLRTMTHS